MHERERHRIILSAVQEKPVVTVQDIAELTDASEATIRRDIASLHVQGKLRRVRAGGGCTSAAARQSGGTPFPGFRISQHRQKRAIARKAVDLCDDGDAIILNGGTTTFQMVHYMAARRLQVMTNSFAIAEHLIKHSKCNVSVPGGAIYRDQSLILSPFDNDAIRNFYARRIFLGAQGVGALGIMESDALVIQSEQKLMRQAEELIVMVDSSKFRKRSSLILCPLENVTTIITDEGISDDAARMVGSAGVTLVIAGTVAGAQTPQPPDEEGSASVA